MQGTLTGELRGKEGWGGDFSVDVGITAEPLTTRFPDSSLRNPAELGRYQRITEPASLSTGSHKLKRIVDQAQDRVWQKQTISLGARTID